MGTADKMLKPDSVYGYAHHDDVDDAIAARVHGLRSNMKTDVAMLLGEALAVIGEINQSIPVQSENRHLIANALENFANG